MFNRFKSVFAALALSCGIFATAGDISAHAGPPGWHKKHAGQHQLHKHHGQKHHWKKHHKHHHKGHYKDRSWRDSREWREHRRQKHARWHDAKREAPQNRWQSHNADTGLNGISGGNIIGALLGAAAGTQIGKGRGRTAAIIGGTIIGAIVGGRVDAAMDRNDRARSHAALETARTGQTVAWKNPDTKAEYTITPQRTYQTAGNQYCREYTSWAFVNGYERQVYGTACRMPDGSWKIVE